MPWDPDQYHKFQAERFAPFADLVLMTRVREGMRAIDLGCGTGELTRRLADMLPGSTVVGIDSSLEMLERARGLERPGLSFQRRSIEEVDGSWDLIFSHAALQWVDDHQTLIPRLLNLLAPEGQLAIQIPSNHDHPAQRLIRTVAAEEPFNAALGGWQQEWPVLPLPEYAELLFVHGGRELTVVDKIYPHELDGADSIAEWLAGTALVPFFERLPEKLHEPFMERYRAKLRKQWPSSPVLYGFKRTLLAATRPA